MPSVSSSSDAASRGYRGLQSSNGAIDDGQYESRRAGLLAQLEQVYGALDSAGGGAGGQGVAA